MIRLVYKFKGHKTQMRLVTPEAFAVRYADLKAQGAQVLVDLTDNKIMEQAA